MKIKKDEKTFYIGPDVEEIDPELKAFDEFTKKLFDLRSIEREAIRRRRAVEKVPHFEIASLDKAPLILKVDISTTGEVIFDSGVFGNYFYKFSTSSNSYRLLTCLAQNTKRNVTLLELVKAIGYPEIKSINKTLEGKVIQGFKDLKKSLKIPIDEFKLFIIKGRDSYLLNAEITYH